MLTELNLERTHILNSFLVYFSFALSFFYYYYFFRVFVLLTANFLVPLLNLSFTYCVSYFYRRQPKRVEVPGIAPGLEQPLPQLIVGRTSTIDNVDSISTSSSLQYL